MNNKYFFIHTGDRIELAHAELHALTKTYYPNAGIQNLGERISIVDGDIDVRKVSSRSACIKYAGRLLSIDSMDFEPDRYFKNYKRFSCRLINLSKKNVNMEVVSLLGKYVKENSPGMKVSLEDPDVNVMYIVTDNVNMIGFTENHYKQKQQDPRKRPFFHPVALESKLSRVMVNLTMVKENSTLLDPFCGTGSILLEAADMNIRIVGCDLSSRMCCGALKNTKHRESYIVNCDALSLPLQFKNIDAIATDLPYGKAASTMKRGSKKLLEGFVSLINREMKGKRCCIMCNKEDVQLFDNIVEQYDIYEHRSLTRKLMVLCN